MQSFYDTVQTRSNIQLNYDVIHNTNDLETKPDLVMNTKVVPYAILNMLKAFTRFHTHFILWFHVNPNLSKVIK